MGKVVLDMEALKLAGAKVGVFGQDNLSAHLGMDVTGPVSFALLAAVNARLPVALGDVVRLIDVTDEDRRPDGEWPVALARQ